MSSTFDWKDSILSKLLATKVTDELGSVGNALLKAHEATQVPESDFGKEARAKYEAHLIHMGMDPKIADEALDSVLNLAIGSIGELPAALKSVPGKWSEGAYGHYSELIPIEQLKKMQGNVLGKTDIEALKRSIQQQGLDEPLIMSYDPTSGLAKLGEGNHRLRALEELGYTEAPVRGYRSSLDASEQGATKIRMKPSQDGIDKSYYPADTKPSDVLEFLRQLEMDKTSRMARAKEMGFDTSRTFYHGTKADLKEFEPEALGASTGAHSAKQGFFFASDAPTTSDYATNQSKSRIQLQGAVDERRLSKELDAVRQELINQYGENLVTPEKLNGKIYAIRIAGQLGVYGEEEVNNLIAKAKQEALKIGDDPPYLKLKDVNNRYEKAIDNSEAPTIFGEDYYKSAEEVGALDRKMRDLFNDELTRSEQSPDWHDLNNKSKELLNKHRAIRDSYEFQGANVIPVHLQMENPYVHDFNGNSYRDSSYSDIMKKAKEKGHDSVLFKNTFDPGHDDHKVMQDIAAVFEPHQIRSVNANFDPDKRKMSDILAGVGGATVVGSGMANSQDADEDENYPKVRKLLGL